MTRRIALLFALAATACETDTRDLHTERGADGAVFRPDARVDGGFRGDGGSFPQDGGARGDGGPSVCNGLDEASCRGSPNCVTLTCTDCQGNTSFIGCGDPNEEPAVCPGACPPPRCLALDEATCAVEPGCHRVFVNEPNCGCAPAGCCTKFSHCAEGEFADCTGGEVICDALPPTCEGSFVVAFSNGCYEGCASMDECAP
jgi:hypothetical protein